MPALVKSSVGSFAGTSEELRTILCPRAAKKSGKRFFARPNEPTKVFVCNKGAELGTQNEPIGPGVSIASTFLSGVEIMEPTCSTSRGLRVPIPLISMIAGGEKWKGLKLLK